VKKIVWTEAYMPFIMGGDCNAPVATELEVGEPVDLGKGISAYVIIAPSGALFVAEATTGAFVGTDLEEVKKDVASAHVATITNQIDAAKERFKKARMMPKDKFWSLFR